MRRIRKRYVLPFCVIGTLALGWYLAFVHRYHMHVEHGGWVVDFSYIAFACPFCLGRVERLTCNDRPIPLPHLTEEDYVALTLKAPVGTFETRAGWTEYRSHGVGTVSFQELGDPISAEELAQSYYDVPALAWPPAKPGTLRIGARFRWRFQPLADLGQLDHLSWEPATAPANQTDSHGTDLAPADDQ
jgi:hypothetical protein